MRVLFVKPNEKAYVTEIEDSLEAMQSAVGGLIEELIPYDDDVAIICNEEGKMMGLPLNRALYTESGELYDIIAGDFFLAYAPMDSESFLSLTDEQIECYMDKFGMPEQFFRSADRKIRAVKFDPAA